MNVKNKKRLDRNLSVLARETTVLQYSLYKGGRGHQRATVQPHLSLKAVTTIEEESKDIIAEDSIT